MYCNVTYAFRNVPLNNGTDWVYEPQPWCYLANDQDIEELGRTWQHCKGREVLESCSTVYPSVMDVGQCKYVPRMQDEYQMKNLN